MTNESDIEVDVDRDEGEENVSAITQTQSSQGVTLLPAPIASAVSLVIRSSSLYLRFGAFIGGLALGGARVTTLTGLELSRAVIEGILNRAGRDVAVRSIGDLGRAEAEGLLEKSITTLHRTITNVSFVASTSFYFSAAALSSATDLSQQLLGFLDFILGSTDSSRAVASIITLIRREFQNPATGIEGEKVGVADLLMGICGLALLQRWSRRLTDQESQDQQYEDIIWDVVISNDGRRADVTNTNSRDNSNAGRLRKPRSKDSISFMTTHGDQVLETIERDGQIQEDSEDDLPEVNLKRRIMRSLPSDASVSITTSTTTTKTVTMEITGAQPPDLTPPPGVEIVEKNAHHTGDVDLDGEVLNNEQKLGLLIPRYRVVYRIVKNNLRGASIQAGGEIGYGEEAVLSDGEPKDFIKNRPTLSVSPITLPTVESPPPVPEKVFSSWSNFEPGAGSSNSQISLTGSSATQQSSAATSAPSTVKLSSENVANQRRPRKPMSSSSPISGSDTGPAKKKTKSPSAKRIKSDRPSSKTPDMKNSIRNALKKGTGPTISNLFSKDTLQDSSASATKGKGSSRPPWGSSSQTRAVEKPKVPIPGRASSMVPARDALHAPQRGNPNYFSSRDLGHLQSPDLPRSPSRASYYSVHERRRDSLVSQTDTYSIHSADQRPGSPTAYRTHLRAESSLLRAKSEKNVSQQPSSPSPRIHRRSKSFIPSIYTLKTNNSETSLILASQPRRSAFEDSETLASLARTGFVDGLFPQHHIVRNITRFVGFASASYGGSFLRIMGISTVNAMKEIDTSQHHEHHSFSNHIQLPADTILLSSFVDPNGGTDSSAYTDTGVPMVHFVSLDHDSKAVVLTCRGTLGFEDVLTDMTCDYDELTWRGSTYKVHKGMLSSARRLISGGGGRVLSSIKVALEEFPDYGLVLCGHSLGGGVATLLAIMISEPAAPESAFITSSEYQRPQLMLPSTAGEGTAPSALLLPPGRSIHVYAYGPPATISPSLRLATRGLVTTIVNGQDLVPYLSLGTLHDLQAVALAFKSDDTGAKGEVRNRVWSGFMASFKDRWYNGQANLTVANDKEEDDQWAYAALKVLRSGMLSAKLVPPGEVFVVETAVILKRDAFTGQQQDGASLGKPATRSVLRYVRDVERRFGEVSFGGSMLLDHSSGRYEASLGALKRGVLDT